MVVKTKVLHIIEVLGFKKNINVLKNELFNCFNIQKKILFNHFVTATVATAEKTVLILFSYDNNNNHNNYLFKLFISRWTIE